MGDASTRSRHHVLAPLAKANNIVDGLPEVLAFVRNRVVHPITKPKQKGSVALIDQVLHRRGCDDAPGFSVVVRSTVRRLLVFSFLRM